MKRLTLSPREVEIIQGLRHERAIYNAALTDAVLAIQKKDGLNADARTADAIETILALRKED